MPAWTELVSREFSDVDLGDERLEKRCRQLASQLSAHPDKSVPQACRRWADTKAAYRFFSNERVTREKLLEPHIAQTVERSSELKTILAIQDTTFFNMGLRPGTEGLGSIGNVDEACGFLAHSAIAVSSSSGEVLGLLHQEVWARGDRKPRDERTYLRRQRPRESERWARGIEAVADLAIPARVVHVFDREGDVYEAIELLDRMKQGYVIRASSNRKLSGKQGCLLDKVRTAAELGRIDVDVPARDGRPARKVDMVVRAETLRIRPPLEFYGDSGREIDVGIVHLLETGAKPGSDTLEWFLLTDHAPSTIDDCERIAADYARRWKIEEFHMGLKTGCRLEERQLRSRGRLEAYLGMADVIAILLLRLRDLSRSNSEAKADAVLSPIQRILLAREFPKLGERPEGQAALRAVARLGGFLARRSDGQPGWRTIWRGMQSLLLMEYGCILAGASAD